MPADDRPLLVFFTSLRSGQARRMESLLAHITRKERSRLRVSKVDVDDRPDLAERFRVEHVPSLVLVVEKRVVSRIDGRATAPRIQAMLEPYLGEVEAVAPRPRLSRAARSQQARTPRPVYRR